MKRFLTIAVALLITFTISAQKQKKEKVSMAKKATTEMTNLLELDKNTSENILALQKEKYANLKEANTSLKNDKEALKTRKKEINVSFRENMISLIGKEKMKKWSDHMKAQRSKKTKKSKE